MRKVLSIFLISMFFLASVGINASCVLAEENAAENDVEETVEVTETVQTEESAAVSESDQEEYLIETEEPSFADEEVPVENDSEEELMVNEEEEELLEIKYISDSVKVVYAKGIGLLISSDDKEWVKGLTNGNTNDGSSFIPDCTDMWYYDATYWAYKNSFKYITVDVYTDNMMLDEMVESIKLTEDGKLAIYRYCYVNPEYFPFNPTDETPDDSHDNTSPVGPNEGDGSEENAVLSNGEIRLYNYEQGLIYTVSAELYEDFAIVSEEELVNNRVIWSTYGIGFDSPGYETAIYKSQVYINALKDIPYDLSVELDQDAGKIYITTSDKAYLENVVLPSVIEDGKVTGSVIKFYSAANVKDGDSVATGNAVSASTGNAIDANTGSIYGDVVGQLYNNEERIDVYYDGKKVSINAGVLNDFGLNNTKLLMRIEARDYVTAFTRLSYYDEEHRAERVINLKYGKFGELAGYEAGFVYTLKDGDVALPSPTMEGYMFAGWYDNEQFTGEKYTVLKVSEVSASTLYAKWISTNNETEMDEFKIIDGVVSFTSLQPVLTEQVALYVTYEIADEFVGAISLHSMVNGKEKVEYPMYANSVFVVTLSAKELSETVQVWAEYNGEKSEVKELSLKNYCETILEGNYSEGAKSIASALIKYGMDAKSYFTSEMVSEYEGTDLYIEKTTPYKYSIRKLNGSPYLHLSGASLILDSKTSIKVYYNIDAPYSCLEYTFNVEGPGELQYYATDTYLEIYNIKAPFLLANYHITIIENQTGNVAVELNYSPMSYAYSVLKTTDESKTALRNLMKSMFDYGDAIARATQN